MSLTGTKDTSVEGVKDAVTKSIKKTAWDEGYKQGRRVGHLNALRDAITAMSERIVFEENQQGGSRWG